VTALRRLVRLVKPYTPRHARPTAPAARLDPSQTQPFPVVLADLGDIQ
jgi:hypothetical protein